MGQSALGGRPEAWGTPGGRCVFYAHHRYDGLPAARKETLERKKGAHISCCTVPAPPAGLEDLMLTEPQTHWQEERRVWPQKWEIMSPRLSTAPLMPNKS